MKNNIHVLAVILCALLLCCYCLEQEQTTRRAANREERRRLQREQRQERREERERRRKEYKEELSKRREQQRRQRTERRKQQEEKWQEVKSNFNSSNIYNAYATVFPTDPPRDVLEGAWNAAKSVFLGGLIGASSLFVFPFASVSSRSGVLSFIIGAILGSLTGLTVFLVGLVTGIYQVLVGLYHTPVSVFNFWTGKRWDPMDREWHVYSLEQEANALLSYCVSRRVQDLTYYELLEVPTDATSKEIKRAYYRKAKDVHPDHNSDQDAAAKFLELHNAYQTLSDDDKRAAYDESGARDDDTTWNFNVDVFFAILFGSQLVDQYIGQLTVATFLGQMINLYRSGVFTPETWLLLKDESRYKSRKRQVEVALNLLNRVEPFVRGDVSDSDFRATCNEEAGRIAETGFGETFLTLIGSNLVLQANAYLRFHRSILSWPLGLYSVAVKKKRQIEYKVESLRLTAQVIWDFVHRMKDVPSNATESSADKESDPDRKKKRISSELIERMLPLVLGMAWAHNAKDIASTLDGACWKLFNDAGVYSDVERIRRAEAVQILGEELVRRRRDADTCRDGKMDTNLIKARVEVAFKVAQIQVSGFRINLLSRCIRHAFL
jgi:curved DNA-binding protein CbpA